MTTDKDIKLCAKALGMRYRIDGGALVELFDDGHAEWNPRTDQADSDNMACDLEINTLFAHEDAVYCFAGPIGFRVQHDNTTEGRRAAVREARVQVAAEMGRVIK